MSFVDTAFSPGNGAFGDSEDSRPSFPISPAISIVGGFTPQPDNSIQIDTFGSPENADSFEGYLKAGESVISGPHNSTGAVYTINDGDVGSTIRLEVTATNEFGNTVRDSAGIIILPRPPENTSPPVIQASNTSSTTEWVNGSGGTLQSGTGDWLRAESYAYQWFLNGAEIGGNASSINPGDYSPSIGDSFQVRVTATGPGGTENIMSNTITVTEPPP
jgi:hypothetical protein